MAFWAPILQSAENFKLPLKLMRMERIQHLVGGCQGFVLQHLNLGDMVPSGIFSCELDTQAPYTRHGES